MNQTQGGTNTGGNHPVVFWVPKSTHWPAKAEDYPFWEWLSILGNEKDSAGRENKGVRDHINKTIGSAIKLGDPDQYKVNFPDLVNSGGLSTAIHEIFGYEGPTRKEPGLFKDPRAARDLLAVMAVYHDIGKTITRPGHPELGYHILHDMRPEERKEAARQMRCRDYDRELL